MTATRPATEPTTPARAVDTVLADLVTKDLAAARDAYRDALVALAEEDPRILCVEADLGGQRNEFARRFPDRYLNFGLAEANMISAAAGLASTGLIPFVHTMASFATARACEQIKIDLAYQRSNVKIVATYGGLAGSAFGPTHHATEDLAIMRALPGLTVINPADAVETVEAVTAAAGQDGPWYIRLGRDPTPIVYPEAGGFRPGATRMLRPGTDVLLVASGQSAVPIALEAAESLAALGISAGVLAVATIKPLDAGAVGAAIRRATGRVVTVEEHNIIGGLGSAVAEVIAEHGYGRLVRLGVPDTFVDGGGSHLAVLRGCGISATAVVAAAAALLDHHPHTTNERVDQ